MCTHLRISPDTVKDIYFHRVHSIGPKKPTSNRPRPTVAKFEHFQQKLLVRHYGKQLKGMDYGLNNQFP